jgi:hypothetical protein
MQTPGLDSGFDIAVKLDLKPRLLAIAEIFEVDHLMSSE